MTFLFSILLFFFNAHSTLHDIHISKAELHFKSDQKVMQISMHIFLDDLEAELVKLGGQDLFLCTKKESAEGDTYLKQYINQNFKILGAGEPLSLEYVGKEISEDLLAVWCYFQVPMETDEDLALINQIMLTRFEDQKNIVSFKKDGKRKAFFILDKDGYIEDLK